MEETRMDMAEITEERRRAIAATIRPLSAAEVAAMGQELFPYHDDPWRERFFAFLDEHPAALFHHASAGGDVQVLYCLTADRGIWFVPGRGAGLLQERGRKMLAEIAVGAL